MNAYNADISQLGIMKTKTVDSEIHVFNEKFLHYTEQDFFDSWLTAIKLARLEMFARRVPIIIDRYGSATYKRVMPYSPIIPTGIFYTIAIDETDRISRDIRIFYHTPLKAFKCSKAGVYTINVMWHIDIPEPNLMNFVELHLYKNGAAYKMLDRQPMKATLPMVGDAMHKEVTLQGSKDIDLLPDDWFDIRIRHDKAAGFGVDELHGGYIDIDYNNDWSNT